MIGSLPNLKTLVGLQQIPELCFQAMTLWIFPAEVVAIRAIRRRSRIARKIFYSNATGVFLDLAQSVEQLGEDFAATIVNILPLGDTGGREPLADHAAHLGLGMS